MTDTSSLLPTLAVALLAAGLSGAIAARLGRSVILGYIVAGVIVGPHTPGFVADGEECDGAGRDRRGAALRGFGEPAPRGMTGG